jgi:hypothetical protein
MGITLTTRRITTDCFKFGKGKLIRLRPNNDKLPRCINFVTNFVFLQCNVVVVFGTQRDSYYYCHR